MSDMHITQLTEKPSRPYRWGWACSCGEKSEGYPSRTKALNGGDVHRALRVALR